MKGIKVLCVFALTLLIIIANPVGMASFVAAEAVLRQVVIRDSDEVHGFLTGAATVGALLRERGITLNEQDRVSHAHIAPIWDGMIITIEREVGFFITLDGNPLFSHISSPGLTINEVLVNLQEELGIGLVFGGETDAIIRDGDTLNLESWNMRLETDIFEVPYETIENFTRSVFEGRSHVRQEGFPGEIASTTQIIYIGGAEANRGVVETVTLTQPIDEIIDIGIARLGQLADVNAPDFHYLRHLVMEATAYTAGYCCTGKHPDDPWYGITASGRRVEHGIVAVDRTLIPLGTMLYVENYGFALAADVGGAIRGYSIDLYMTDLQDARNFGRRFINVWILE